MSNFQTIKEELHPLLLKAEKARKPYRFLKNISIFFFQLFLFSIALPILLAYSYGDLLNLLLIKLSKMVPVTDEYSFYLMYSIIGIICLVFLSIYGNYYQKYKKKETEILKAFLKKMIPDFKFNPFKNVQHQTVMNSGIFLLEEINYKKSYPTYSINGNKVLSGKVNGTELELCNLNITGRGSFQKILMYIPLVNLLALTLNYIKPWFTKKTNDQIGTIFLGMFAIAKFNKKIKGRTVVLPDTFEKRIGYLAKILQSINFKREQLVNLEDTEFEKEFVVYSTNQVEARYILSHSLMERIMVLRKKIDRPIMLSFKGNKMYMAVEHPYGFLSLLENKNLIESDALETFYHNIAMAIGIVEDLNLKTKIWG